jgi:hypothetical protein
LVLCEHVEHGRKRRESTRAEATAGLAQAAPSDLLLASVRLSHVLAAYPQSNETRADEQQVDGMVR